MKIKKLYKKYERWVLIGLVVLLLATFSIGGALTNCGGEGRGGGNKLGGTYEPVPGEEVELEDAGFDQRHGNYTIGQRALQMPTLEFRDIIMSQAVRPPDPRHASWMHILASDAAKRAGYNVGTNQLNRAIEELVGLRMRNAGLRSTQAAYQQFLRDEYRGTQTDFEQMVREIIAKDEFLSPLVHTAVYDRTYAEAYDDWKVSRERVELEYVSLPAAPFADAVREAESTRKQISEQATLLQNLTRAARSVRALWSRAEKAKASKEVYPKDLEELAAGLRSILDQKDPWGNAFRYKVESETLDVRSAGPDGEFDTADDVSDEVRRTVQSHGAVQLVADAVMKWKSSTDKWPTKLTDLLERPAEGTVPPIPQEKRLKDGWDRELVLEAKDDATPTLFSVGADGQPGTDDDIHAQFEGERAGVKLSPGLSPFVLADLRDAWGHALQVGITNPTLWLWSVKSPGKDGKFGSDDDLDEGNKTAIDEFFAKNRPEFRLPTKRAFEAIYVLLPLLSDAVLGELWKAYPQHQPKSEQAVFEHWKLYRGEGLFYRAENPADPEKGHGVEAMKKLAPGRAMHLVPDAALFPSLDKEGDGSNEDKDEGEPKKEEPKDDGDEKGDEGADDEQKLPPAPDPDEPLRKIYNDAGWRSVVIRDMFVEAILNDVLTRARASETAIRAWEQQYGRFEKKDDEKGDDDAKDDGKPKDEDAPADDDGNGDEPKKDEPKKEEAEPVIPARPQEVTFQQLLEAELAPYVSDDEKVFVYWRADEPMVEEAWRENAILDDNQLRLDLNRLAEKGRYANIPTQMHGMTVKAVVRNLELLPSRQPAMEEVEDKVYEAYLVERQMDAAVEALRDLQDAAERIVGEGEEDPEAARLARWPGALAEWKQSHDAALVERTGRFIGQRPPSPVKIEDDADENDPEILRLKRRNFIWRRGYNTVARSPSKQDELTATPGIFGRTILTDRGGTDRAYLVRVASQSFPSKAEFSPRRYAEYMRERTYGPMGMPPRQRRRLRDRPGSLNQSLARYVDDMEFMRHVFKLQTTTNLDLLHVP